MINGLFRRRSSICSKLYWEYAGKYPKFTNLNSQLFSSENGGRELVKLEEEILGLLRNVKVNDQGNVVGMGLVKELKINKDAGLVEFSLISGDNTVRMNCEKALRTGGIPWIKQEPIITIKDISSMRGATKADGLDQVKKIIAVSSCKGGVGKSTVAVNLALALKNINNYNIGILDTDIYGPSLPTMMVSDDEDWAVSRSSNLDMIQPVKFHGIQCMSYGFVAPGTGGRKTNSITSAAVLRGPIVSNIVTQLALKTNWGKLDYLIIDMPPGTGDIHITLGQDMTIDGAVIVTTPQMLSFVDVVKGLEMFDKLNVPTVAVVENMSWFDGDDGKRYQPFGPGHLDKLQKEFGISNSFTLPILEAASFAADHGKPFMSNEKNYQTDAGKVYTQLAEGVDSEVNNNHKPMVQVKFDKEKQLIRVRYFQDNQAKEGYIEPYKLRTTLDKVDKMLGITEIDKDILPVSIKPMGNYAISIQWTDGHEETIYPYQDIIKLL